MVRTVNTNSPNPSPDKNSDGEWTTIPVKPKLPQRPGKTTLYMFVLNSYFPMSTNKWIWHCYLDDKDLTPNPRGPERSSRIQKAFVKSGNFFAEHGIVLRSLNISTSRLVELFFGSEEDLWKADALVEQYSQAMIGGDGCISRQEHTGKMVCHGVHLPDKYTGKFVGKWDLEEERLRELEDLNPVFHSNGNKMIYRIRSVHYMSSRAPKEQLMKTGETWAVTFSDFRVAECFVDGYAEFDFFVGPCPGGLKWYKDHPYRFFHNNTNDFQKGPGSNGAGSASGAVESSSPTASGANKRVQDRIEGLVPSESPEQAKSTPDVRVGITKQKKPEDQVLATLLEQARSRASLKVTSAGQQESENQSITTATTGGFNQAAVARKPDDQIITTVAGDGLKQAVIAKKPKAQMPTNALTKQATNAATVKINITEQGKPQPLQHLAKTTPTPTSINSAGDEATGASCIGAMLEPEPKSQPPPPSGKPIATGALKKLPPSVPTEGVKRQNLKKAGAKGAKITPPAKEPISGNNNSTPAPPVPSLVVQTTVTRATQPSRQHRQPNPRQKRSDNTAATATTAASTGVSAGKGEATATLVDTSQLKIEKIPSLEATVKRKQTKSGQKGKAGKKKADKKPPATGASGGGGGKAE